MEYGFFMEEEMDLIEITDLDLENARNYADMMEEMYGEE